MKKEFIRYYDSAPVEKVSMSYGNKCGFSKDAGDDSYSCSHQIEGEFENCIWHRDPDEKENTEIEEALEATDGTIYYPKFSGMDLSEVTAVDLTLNYADFSGGSLTDVTFQNVDLSHATFDEQHLNNVKYFDCDLSGATFNGSGTTIESSTIQGNDHNELEFREAKINDPTFEKVGINNGSLYNAEINGGDLSGFTFTQGDISLAEFRYVELTSCQFIESEATKVEFVEGKMANIDFDNREKESTIRLDSVNELDINILGRKANSINVIGCTDFSLKIAANQVENVSITDCKGVNLKVFSHAIENFTINDLTVDRFQLKCDSVEQTDIDNMEAKDHGTLEGVTFSGKQLCDISFGDGKIKNCQLKEIDITKLSIENGSVIDTNFKSTPFSEVSFIDSSLEDLELLESNLSGSNFSGSNFSDNCTFKKISMSNCNLHDAKCNGLTLYETNLEKSVLSNSDLRDVDLRGAGLYDAKFDSTRINDETEFGDICIYEFKADRVAEDTFASHENRLYENLLELESNNNNNIDKYRQTDNILLRLVSALGNGPARLLNRGFRNPAWRSKQSDLLAKAARTYRAYQDLLRKNGLPEDIHKYRIREKNARRKRALVDRNILTWIRFSFLRWSIGYGEQYRNVLINSVAIILVCAYLYSGGITSLEETGIGVPNLIADSPIGNYISRELYNSFYFSITTFTTLGLGEINPVNDVTRIIAASQSLIGTALTAVLVYILGRRATW